jgi:hypothetical protein
MAETARYYIWKHGYEDEFLGDAEACGRRREELEALLEEDRGLQAQDILTDAESNVDSPFRADVFKDSESKAAKQWRLEVCRKILRCLVVVDVVNHDANQEPRKIERPAVIHVPGGGYIDAMKVLTDEDLFKQAVAEIVRDIEVLQRKVAQLQTLKAVYAELELLKKKVRSAKPPRPPKPRPHA